MKHRGNKAGFGPRPPARMTACLFWKPIVAVTFYTLAGATQAFTIPRISRSRKVSTPLGPASPSQSSGRAACSVYTGLLALRQACRVVIRLTRMPFEVGLNMSYWTANHGRAPMACSLQVSHSTPGGLLQRGNI